MKRPLPGHQRGFILIVALWTLTFLTVLAIAVGVGTRQKIILLDRLEARSRIQLAVEAGIKKAVAILVDDLEESQFRYTTKAKARRHNNPNEFFNIQLGDLAANVTCPYFDEAAGKVIERYGVCDEQGKLNLNVVDKPTLENLIADVLGYPAAEARSLAENIMDWRDYGKHTAEGFFSDDYYKNLEFPYPMKDLPFERIDELFLVKGITDRIYYALVPYITVYGDGRVNVNTASRKVLMALGLDGVVADKLLKARSGQDGRDSTDDDHVFNQVFDVASEVKALVPLEEKEVRQIDALNARNLLTTDSMIFSMISLVHPVGNAAPRSITAVFNGYSNKFEYWYEK
jgi:type II secretory pathway component PulK